MLKVFDTGELMSLFIQHVLKCSMMNWFYCKCTCLSLLTLWKCSLDSPFLMLAQAGLSMHRRMWKCWTKRDEPDMHCLQRALTVVCLGFALTLPMSHKDRFIQSDCKYIIYDKTNAMCCTLQANNMHELLVTCLPLILLHTLSLKENEAFISGQVWIKDRTSFPMFHFLGRMKTD